MEKYIANRHELSFFVREMEGVPEVIDGCSMRPDEFFGTISREICFSDISDVEITLIVWRGENWDYTGWKPDHEFRYETKDGGVYTFWGPDSWDH